MSSPTNDPRMPSAAKPFKPPLVSPQDLPVDYSGFLAVLCGVVGVMFRRSEQQITTISERPEDVDPVLEKLKSLQIATPILTSAPEESSLSDLLVRKHASKPLEAYKHHLLPCLQSVHTDGQGWWSHFHHRPRFHGTSASLSSIEQPISASITGVDNDSNLGYP